MAATTINSTTCGTTTWDRRSGTKVPLCPDHHYEIEKHINKGFDGVTRKNAHLDFVRRKPRTSSLTLGLPESAIERTDCPFPPRTG
jgi:hypothetical protein